MTLTRWTRIAAGAVCAWVVAVSGAAAQDTPGLSASVNGTAVTIQWTGVPGAAGYHLIVNGSVTTEVNLPATTTMIVVDAPAGSYRLRVRGTAGSVQGPFSNEVTLNVGSAPPGSGGGACTQPPAPVVTTAVAGAIVTVTWPAVPGVVGYRVEFSRTPGGTEVVQNLPAGQTSYSQFVPLLGTFYVRVVTGNACGAATSVEKSFTIDNLSVGSGPRAPDPAPGQLIPRASLGYAGGVIAQVAAEFNGDLQNSCREHGGNNIFMFRLVQRLRQIDGRWGLNDKRGNAGDMSQDILAYNPTSRADNGESQVYLYDVISGHCGGRADVWFDDVTDVTWSGRGNPACGTTFCARWTIDQYLRAGGQ